MVSISIITSQVLVLIKKCPQSKIHQPSFQGIVESSAKLSYRGHILANIMNELEVMWTQFVDQGFEPFLNEYLSLWLHTNQKVHVNGDTGTTEAIIQGIECIQR